MDVDPEGVRCQKSPANAPIVYVFIENMTA